MPKNGFLVLCAALLASGTPALSNDAKTCAGDAMIAGMIMTHRQMGGMDVNEMMEKFGSEPGLRQMVIDAYEKPAMQTKATRKIMIDEFKNTWSLKCYKEGSALPRKAD